MSVTAKPSFESCYRLRGDINDTGFALRVMIPLTGRDRQHSTFTLALQPNMSTPASANTMETWPYSPALTTESAAFPTSIPGSSFAHLDLPEAQHEKASEVHEADTCNIFASEQTEDLLFANDLSDLSVFDAIDFDDMLVHATNDMMPTQQQQQQQQLFPDQCKYPHTHLDSASYETGSLSSASAREPILPVAASLQRMQPSKPPTAAMRRTCVPHIATIHNTMRQESQVSQDMSAQVTSEDATAQDSDDYEPKHASKADRGARVPNKKSSIKKSKTVRSRPTSQAKQYSTRAGLKLASKMVACTQDDKCNSHLAKQQSFSSQDQCSLPLTHVSQQTQHSEKHASADPMKALAEGTKLLLASVRKVSSAQQTAACNDSQTAPDLKHRLRSASAATLAGVACVNKAAGTPELASTATPGKLTLASNTLKPAKTAPAQTAIESKQTTATVSDGCVPPPASSTQPATTVAATRTSNSPSRSEPPNIVSAPVLASQKQQQNLNTASKATQTQPDSVATVTVGTQTVAVGPGTASRHRSIGCSVQPQAEVDAAHILSQLAARASATQSTQQASPSATTRLVSPKRAATACQSPKHLSAAAIQRPPSSPTLPRLSSPNRTPRASTVESARRLTPQTSRQLPLSPDARRNNLPRAQRVVASPLRANGSVRPFRGRSLQSPPKGRHAHHKVAPAKSGEQGQKASSVGKASSARLPDTPNTVDSAPAIATPPTADIGPLLADILGTAGCRVTRRLVHSVLANAPPVTVRPHSKPQSKERFTASASGRAKPSAVLPLAKQQSRVSEQKSQLTSHEHSNQDIDACSPSYSTDSTHGVAYKPATSNSPQLPRSASPRKSDQPAEGCGGLLQRHATSNTLTATANRGLAHSVAADLHMHVSADFTDSHSQHTTSLDAACNHAHFASATAEYHLKQGLAGANAQLPSKRQLDDKTARHHPKRQLDGAMNRPELPKRSKTQCLTAAGLNPKFLATKDEVMRLIGDRQNVLEGELRRRMGNNPDTSKALRKLHKEGDLSRSGAGGRSDPFKWTKIVNASTATEVMSCET